MSAEGAAELALSRNGSVERLQGVVGMVPLEFAMQEREVQPASPKTAELELPVDPEGNGRNLLQLRKLLNEHYRSGSGNLLRGIQKVRKY